MKTVYLDVSCLNRPFDDQSQARVRLEAEAILLILERIDAGSYRHVSSQIAELEIAAIRDLERRRRVTALLPAPEGRIALTPAVFARAMELQKIGFKPADASRARRRVAQSRRHAFVRRPLMPPGLYQTCPARCPSRQSAGVVEGEP